METEALMPKRDIDQLPPICNPAGNGTYNLGMCFDWESNLQPFGAWDDVSAN